MSVRILLVGDSQCGKTSIILALVGEEFPLVVPARAEEITIPADVTPEKVPTHIVDYSDQEQDSDMLEQEIIKAHVVCVVYDVTKDSSLDRVTDYWIPFIQQCSTSDNVIRPILLAGNKADLLYDPDIQSLKLQDILNAYVDVETGLECSAKDLHNISELFYFAQKAVLHPTAPLYSPHDKQLKQDCVCALERVFKICDVDNDGLLNDQELNDFQIRCFDAPLQSQALQDVKNIVYRNLPQGIDNGGLTMEGFLFLNKLFIQRGRHETTWKILRKFGYSNDLTLKDDYTQPVFSPQPGHVVQLSKTGYLFLTDLFSKYDTDGDNALSPVEQKNLFSLCPNYPWDEQLISLTVDTNQEEWITLSGFLSFWTLQTGIDYSFTTQFLAWTGFPVLDRGGGNLATALQEVPKNASERCVYNCRVIGSRGCGKTTFVRGLVGQMSNPELDEEESMTIKAITLPGTQEPLYLVLHESSYDPAVDADDKQTLDNVLELCDVACLLYDSSDEHSFQISSQIFESIESSMTELVPCVFIATKSDLPRVKQVCELQPEDLCKEYGLPNPHHVSPTSPEVLTSVYSKLVSVARDPSSNLPSSVWLPSWLKWAGLGVVLSSGLGALVYLVLKRLKATNKPHPF